MKKFCLLVGLSILTLTSFSQTKTNYKVAVVGFYNLENLYDTVNNPMVNDEEFLPKSVRNYNTQVYLDKLDRLAEVISQMGTDINPQGLALLGVAEVENDTVLNDLVARPKIKDRNLKIVHYDSPDQRGVDVGLLYNPKYFTVLSSAPLRVDLPQGSKDAHFTRDVLWVRGLLGPDTLNVFVNHWPSRSGGEQRSRPGRAAAAMVSKRIIDSLMVHNPNTKAIVMGDLNDDPISPSVVNTLGAKGKVEDVCPTCIFNPWIDMYKKGIGTLAYQDAWGLFDQIMFTGAFLDKEQPGFFFQKAYIFNKDFLVQKTGRWKGYSKRTWDGMTYNYGYSDHFPVYTVLLKKVVE